MVGVVAELLDAVGQAGVGEDQGHRFECAVEPATLGGGAHGIWIGRITGRRVGELVERLAVLLTHRLYRGDERVVGQEGERAVEQSERLKTGLGLIHVGRRYRWRAHTPAHAPARHTRGMPSAGRAKLTSAAKRSARRLVDRALTPHLDQQTTQLAQILDARLEAVTGSTGAPPPVAHPLLTQFNHLLHELRTIELNELPATGKVLLSAGCAGAWYFDWLERAAGPFAHHIGVELYSPRPDGLAADVTWISESASHMPAVADASVDVVFSGQNIEHLWIDDMVGFLLEARRVLRPDGWLVVDSPNRLATEALGWVHPEHTVEFAVAEAHELFELAGFRVASTRGLWNCRDRRSREWLPLTPPPDDAAQILARSAGRFDLDAAFVWWIEARPTGDPVDADRLHAAVATYFARHWPSRVNRGAERPSAARIDGSWVTPAGTVGVVARAGPRPLFAGPVRVPATHPGLTVRVLRSDGAVLATATDSVTEQVPVTEFGVIVELIAEHELAEPLSDVAAIVEMEPDPRPALHDT
jgi:SAM-dependent methyltransferase